MELTSGETSKVKDAVGTSELTPCAVMENVRVPTDNVPLNVPVWVGVKTSLNVMLLPGTIEAGSVGAPEIANPVPVAVIAGIETEEIVVCGLLTVKVKLLALVVVPATIFPKLKAVPGWAVKRTPEKSV